MKRSQIRGERQKDLCKKIQELTGRMSAWEVWQDLIVMSACAIAAALPSPDAQKREEMYQDRAKKYSPQELSVFPQIFAEITDALEDNPDQDFLGDMFMQLGLGASCKGQFFTPYSVCRACASIGFNSDFEKELEEKHWVGVNDPACGAGALLVAFANECRRHGINYQTCVLFTAQDLDAVAGMMCYIQLSLLGCPGYVAIADTLAHPCVTVDRRGLIPKAGQDIWYTPMYYRDIWTGRRLLSAIRKEDSK